MKIYALTTGTVSVKHSFLFPGKGVRRQLDLFLPGPWSAPLPIHVWAIEHEGEFFKVAGPLGVPRSPQVRPVLVQAGSSDSGMDFAAPSEAGC